MKNYQKGIIPIIILIIIAVAAIGGGAYIYTKNKSSIQSNATSTPQRSENSQNQNSNQSISTNSQVTLGNQSPITVISPNGGESFKTGDPLTIQWKSTIKGPHIIDIILYRTDETQTVHVVNDLQEKISPETGISKYTWIIPANISGSFEVRVSSLDSHGEDNIDNVIADHSAAPFTINTASSVSKVGWKTYIDPKTGISFKYPTSLNTEFASLNATPTLEVTVDPKKFDSSGCVIMNGSVMTKTSQVTIGGTKFCLLTTGDVGAGQKYDDYTYTTFKNGVYATLRYVVHTSNGCGVYEGTDTYQACKSDLANYDQLVMQPIQQSVATLNIPPSQSSISISTCLPSTIQLSTIAEYQQGKAVTVGGKLQMLGAMCANGKLVDAQGKEIYFYKLTTCWGNPPANYVDLQNQEKQTIANLQATYDVVQLTCNPNNQPIP